MTIASTSRVAFHEHRDSGRLTAQQEAVRRVVERHGALTRNEIATASGIRLSAVCGRVNELVAIGVLDELPRRPDRHTGIAAHPVRIAVAQRQFDFGDAMARRAA